MTFDPERTYRVACLYHSLLGLDAIKPLTDWAAGHSELLPPLDAARPAKNLVLQVCFREIWTLLGAFEDIDVDRTDDITRDELHAALAVLFGIDPSDLSDDLVDDTMRTFDCNADGCVTRAEYEACIAAIRSNRLDLGAEDAWAVRYLWPEPPRQGRRKILF